MRDSAERERDGSTAAAVNDRRRTSAGPHKGRAQGLSTHGAAIATIAKREVTPARGDR